MLQPEADAATPPKPHIVFVLADDLDLKLTSSDFLPRTKALIADQGVAFENIPPGAYRAAASVFRTGTFRLNFGPRFKCWPMPEHLAARLPEAERTAKPVCELVPPLDTQRAVHAIAQARAAELARIEQARAEEEERKAAEVKAQKDALKNARRNARRGVAS